MEVLTTRFTVIIPVGNNTSLHPNFENNVELLLRTDQQVIVIMDESSNQSNLRTQAVISRLSNLVNSNHTIIKGSFGGPGAARNEGMKHIRNEWVVFWDSDDEGIVDSTRQMIHRAQESHSFLAIGKATRINHHKNERVINNSLVGLITWPGIWRMAFHVKILEGKSFATWRWCEDQDMILQTILCDKKISFFDQIVYRYQQDSSNSLTKNPSNWDSLAEFWYQMNAYRVSSSNHIVLELFRLKTLLALSRRNPKHWTHHLVGQCARVLLSLFQNFSYIKRNIFRYE